MDIRHRRRCSSRGTLYSYRHHSRSCTTRVRHFQGAARLRSPLGAASAQSGSDACQCWHSNAYFSLFSSLFFFDHRPWHGRLYAKRSAEWRLLADNPLRLTQVATGPVVPLTSLLSLFEFDVGSQVQPFQTAARTAHLDVGWVAVASSYGVVSDAAELGAEGAVGGTAQFRLPHERCLRPSPGSGQSCAPPLRGATASLWVPASDTATPSPSRSRRLRPQLPT